MPVFDFRCTSCDNRTEHIVLPGDAMPASCSECGGALKRVWGGSRVSISLEGWGFSKNDALLPDRGQRKDWKTLKERAERICDESR